MSQLLKKLILFNLVIGLFSCNVETQNDGSTHESYVSDTLEISPEDPTERAFEFSEMPSKWWLLTKRGDEFIRYNHWDAQDEIIEFVVGKEGSDWMNIQYAHDSDMGDITNFTATLIEGDNISQVNGSFTYYSNLERKSKNINFYWDQLQHYIEFENLVMGARLYYVPEEDLGYFLYEETFREED